MDPDLRAIVSLVFGTTMGVIMFGVGAMMLALFVRAAPAVGVVPRMKTLGWSMIILAGITYLLGGSQYTLGALIALVTGLVAVVWAWTQSSSTP